MYSNVYLFEKVKNIYSNLPYHNMYIVHTIHTCLNTRKKKNDNECVMVHLETKMSLIFCLNHRVKEWKK